MLFFQKITTQRILSWLRWNQLKNRAGSYAAKAAYFTQIALHPLYLYTITLILGIVWQAQEAPLTSTIIIVSAAAVLICYYQRSQALWITLGALFFFFAGAYRYQQKVEAFYRFHQRADRLKCTLTGKIIDREPSYKADNTTQLTISIDQLTAYNRVLSITQGTQIIALVKGELNAQAGDSIVCEPVWFRQPAGIGFINYLIKEGLVGYQFLKSSTMVITDHPSWSCYRTISNLRNNAIERVRSQLSPLTFTLFSTVFWGKHTVDNTQITSIRDHFKPWGILHHLARSGLHLMVLTGLLNRVLVLLPLPIILRTTLMILLILLYSLFSWASISFLRAAIVVLLYRACDLLDLQTHTLYILSLTCALVLLYNPLQLFFLDFELSFSLTFVLAWLNELKRQSKPLLLETRKS